MLLKKAKQAQIAIEFTFAIIVIVVLSLGLIGVFHWTGLDLADRMQVHEETLVDGTDPLPQTRDLFFTSSRITGTSGSDIFGP